MSEPTRSERRRIEKRRAKEQRASSGGRTAARAKPGRSRSEVPSSFHAFLLECEYSGGIRDLDREVRIHLVWVQVAPDGQSTLHYLDTSARDRALPRAIQSGVRGLQLVGHGPEPLGPRSRLRGPPQPLAWVLPSAYAHEVIRGLAEKELLLVCDPARPEHLDRASWIGAVRLRLSVEAASAADRYAVQARLFVGDQEADPTTVGAVVSTDVVILGARVGRIAAPEEAEWLALFQGRAGLETDGGGLVRLVEDEDREALSVSFAPGVAPEMASEPPTPRLRIERLSGWRLLPASLCFDYEGVEVAASATEVLIPTAAGKRRFRRDKDTEARLAADLTEVWPDAKPTALQIPLPAERLGSIIVGLHERGFDIVAEGQCLRAPSRRRFKIRSSGRDWFDLDAVQEYGDQSVPIPELLRAAAKGERVVALPDGGHGFIPTEWLESERVSFALGETRDATIRYATNQAAFLDTLLDGEVDLDLDSGFEEARERVRRAAVLQPADPGDSFLATLRPYQREGFGWLRYLRGVGFGGCLADDMGLGKTAQVLALLDENRDAESPSLVVAPRSLLFHWRDEAARFAPKLAVRIYHGTSRAAALREVAGGEVLVTTYGTLRRDQEVMAARSFDTVILDEAQAIKNRDTATSKAACVLKARQRIAMSGTPIENHLGELDSLFRFLNPGLLGGSRFSDGLLGKEDVSVADRARLAAVLRPFLLRRTKREVAKDLPDRIEQTVRCEMEAPQRKFYDEIRRHYKSTLGKSLADPSAKGRTMHVLEALLRLRQAACDPGLIDKDHEGLPSAKLDVLVPMLKEIADEGHKALVFSQFTSFLKRLKPRLDAEGLRYAYLDGRTRKRQERVDEFQKDDACSLFLISLKAGGVGLNLTAASYVFLLDPWWNPAVEAQAIDRAHRIGQSQTVTAYRLIARDTVEEKIAELQQEKRELADALLGGDNATLRDLDLDEIQRLLE